MDAPKKKTKQHNIHISKNKSTLDVGYSSHTINPHKITLPLRYELPHNMRHDIKLLSNVTQKELDYLTKPDTNRQETNKATQTNNYAEKQPSIDIQIKSNAGNVIVLNKKKNDPSPFVLNLNPEKDADLIFIDDRRKPNQEKKTKARAETFVPQEDNAHLLHITIEEHELANQFTHEEGKLPFIENMLVQLRWFKRLSTVATLALVGIFIIQAAQFYLTVLPTQERVLSKTQDAISLLQKGQEYMFGVQFAQANNSFSEATREFFYAQQDINKLNGFIRSIVAHVPVIGDKYITGTKLLDAGGNLSLSAKYFTQGIDKAHNTNTLSEKISVFSQKSKEILPLLKKAQADFDDVNIDFIPADKKETFIKLTDNLPTLITLLENYNTLSDFLYDASGGNQKKRYLVLFQNNAELRPTGGFIGSYALIDIYKGELVNIHIPGGGSYDLQGGLATTVRPPEPLQLVSDKWEFQDSNWFADFPTAAQKIQWFHEKSGGPSVDGVIAINLPVVEEILAVTGPIEMPEYDKTLTADNFWIEVQKAVELEYDKNENKPKGIISDMTPILIERLLSSNETEIIEIAKIMEKSLREKNILLSFTNENDQRLISSFDWDGRIKETDHDYLSVINTNIAGGKTDRVIRQTINLESEIKEDGHIVNTLYIKREHTGEKQNLFTGVRNVNYMRIYVPEGSTLLSAEGFRQPDESFFKEPAYRSIIDEDLEQIEERKLLDEQSKTAIYNETEKTVFANWSMIDPGETAHITIQYSLPFTVDVPKIEQTTTQKLTGKKPYATVPYSIYFQKQPGQSNTRLNSTLTIPSLLEFTDNTGQTLTYADDFKTDIIQSTSLKLK